MWGGRGGGKLDEEAAEACRRWPSLSTLTDRRPSAHVKEGKKKDGVLC